MVQLKLRQSGWQEVKTGLFEQEEMGRAFEYTEEWELFKELT